jgi:hypothetical protein
VLRGPPCSEVRLARPIATTSLFSSGNLAALATLVKGGSGGHIGHRASYVEVSAEALPKPVRFEWGPFQRRGVMLRVLRLGLDGCYSRQAMLLGNA